MYVVSQENPRKFWNRFRKGGFRSATKVLYPGQSVKFTVHVYGGSSSQDIDNIELKLCCRYVEEVFEDSSKQQGSRKRKVHRTYVLADWSCRIHYHSAG